MGDMKDVPHVEEQHATGHPIARVAPCSILSPTTSSVAPGLPASAPSLPLGLHSLVFSVLDPPVWTLHCSRGSLLEIFLHVKQVPRMLNG